MKYTKDFDRYLKVTKTPEEYYAEKSKAGAIGGSVGRNSPEHNKRLAVCMALGRMNYPAKRLALCLESVGAYECGKKYNITLESKNKISAPYPLELSTYEIAKSFKLYRNK